MSSPYNVVMLKMNQSHHNEPSLYLQITGSSGGPVTMSVAGIAEHLMRNIKEQLFKTPWPPQMYSMYGQLERGCLKHCDIKTLLHLATRCLCNLRNWKKIQACGTPFFGGQWLMKSKSSHGILWWWWCLNSCVRITPGCPVGSKINVL